MAKTKISQFDANAANNTDLNSISIAEGTAPSNINNAIRELMSQLADLNLGNEVLSTLKIDNLHLDGNTIITLDTNGDLNLTPNGTGSVVVAKVDINGGAIDGTSIGGSSASTGAFTTLSASSTANLGSTVTISGGNIDGVIGANTPAAITGTVITANTNFAGDITGNVTGNVTGNLTGNVTGNVTGNLTGDVTGNITASSGSSTFNNVTINGTLDMDSTTSQTITGLATPSNSTDAATKGYVDTEVSSLVDSAPSTLNTLNELAAALGDDASFSTTVTNSIAAKLPLAGGTMTGDINLDSNSLTNLAAPSNNNDAARKAYVDTADALKLNLSGGTLSGNIAMGDNKITGLAAPTADGDAARKKYVDDIAGSGTAAATSASQAATSATNAANSATASANSATAAASSATSAAASLDSFDDRYLGAKSSAPSTDNDGDALVTGALYWNTSSNDLYVWNGSAWEQGAFSTGGVLSNVVEDTTPQLGGDLDAQGKDIEDVGIVSADGIAGIYGSTSSPVTYTVTVASKTAAHPYNGDGSSSAYFLNGIESPALQLQGVDGTTANTEYFYKFDQSHSSNSGHPLRFYKDAAKAEAYTTGVTTNGTAGSSGAYTTIAVDDATPNVLYYECSNHAYMGNYVTTPATSVQGLDAELTAIAGLTSAADKGIQFTGSGTAATYDLTAAGKALLDDADAAAQRTTLGLGTAATTASTDYATAAQGTKADNAAAKASNLSDLASASTARTNLGLGTAATLTAGTSANNAVQLDSNAKLPAVDGSQLTGISGGTDQIDMVVGSGSDAISIGNVVTRESNGETKKVKKEATTTNYSVSAADYVSSTISGTLAGSPSPHTYGTQSAMCGSDDGRFVFVWARGWSTYDLRIKTFIHTGSGNWTIGADFNPSIGQAGSSKPTLRCRFVKNCNASAGGTFFVFFHSTETNGYNQPWKYFMLTVDSSGGCTKYTTAGGTYSGMYDVARIAAGTSTGGSSIYDGDTTIIDTSTDDTVKFLSALQLTNQFVIGEWSVTWTGSQYNGEYIGGALTANQDYRANATSGQSRFTRIAYDHTNDLALIMKVNYYRKFTLIKASPNSGNANWTFNYASDGYGSELTNSGTVDQGYEYRQYITADGHGQVFFSIANYTAGQNTRFQVVAYDLTESSYSTSAWDRFIYTTSSSGNLQGAIPIHYDHLNQKLFVIGFDGSGNPHDNPNNNLRVYTFSGITDTLESNLTQSSYDGNSGSRYSRYGFWGMVDTVSLSAITDTKAGRWVQIAQSSATGWTGSSVKIKSGTLPHSVTTNTTNKALAFGFAQKAGSAGDTISVLPFDSESIEQNQSSLTHGTKYYVTSTGALSTATTPDSSIANDPDNPLVGEAINTTNLRLPTKSITGGGGGGDPKVFCGAVDFRRDSGVGTSVILSKPDSLTASEIRAYEIHFYGVGVSNDTSYNIRFKPYKNGSSVMSGNFKGVATGNYNGSSYTSANHSWSSYLSFRMYGANYPYRANSASIQNYSAGGSHSGKLTGKVVYENNIKNGAFSYVANVRTGGSDYYMNNEMGSFGSTDNANTTDYAEQFYFYTGTGSFEEGVIVLYAIKK